MQSEYSAKKIMGKISNSQIEELSRKKIYFGHQSVGFNIIDGIEDIKAENGGIDLSIVETKEANHVNFAGLYHSRIGQNRDWNSKINDFKKVMHSGFADVVDIAFFKFCYVDITAETNVQDIFDVYTQAMKKLSESYPETRFLHATIPLKVANTSWKTWVKKLIGKEMWEYKDNIKRNEFNALMRQEYATAGKLFDLALAESMYPDGRMETFTHDGKKYNALIADYTYDGGHLNEKVRKIVASTLLKGLSSIFEGK